MEASDKEVDHAMPTSFTTNLMGTFSAVFYTAVRTTSNQLFDMLLILIHATASKWRGSEFAGGDIQQRDAVSHIEWRISTIPTLQQHCGTPSQFPF